MPGGLSIPCLHGAVTAERKIVLFSFTIHTYLPAGSESGNATNPNFVSWWTRPMSGVPFVSCIYSPSGPFPTEKSAVSAAYQYHAFGDGTAKLDSGTFSPPAEMNEPSASAEATESSISLMEGSVVEFASPPFTAAEVIV